VPRSGQISKILLAAAFFACSLVVLQGLADRLLWWTPGFPFGANYDAVHARLFVQDFAYNYGLTKAAVLGTIDAPYTEQGQLEFMRQWIGRGFGVALGYGYSPTLGLLFAPLLPMPTTAAYVVWALAPALCLLAAAATRLGGNLDERDRFSLLLLLVLLGSASYQGEIQLGKTAVVLGMIAFALITACRGRGDDRAAGLLLFLLTAAPPLALAMGLGLLIDRRPKAVSLALCLVAIEVACVAALLGPGWVGDYIRLLTHYTSDTAPRAFRPFLRPDGMSNVRHLLVTLGWADHTAATASVAGWATVMAVALAMRDGLRPGTIRLSLALLAFTIFSPHLTFSNDLLVVIVVWFMHAEADLRPLTRAVLIGLLVVILDSGPSKAFLLNDVGANLALLAKLAVAIVLLAVGRFDSRIPA
jgi:hypothetical protein